MRFLFITTIYPLAEGQTWMANELAGVLKRRGHAVDVVFLDWAGAVGQPTQTVRDVQDVSVIRVSPRAATRFGRTVNGMSKMLLTPRHTERELAKRIDYTNYDALITFTPASSIASTLRRASHIPTRILFVFDFYPIYQRELGLIPGGPIYQFALRREETLYRSFTTLICNLPANIGYLRRHYRVPAEQRILAHPLWSDVSPIQAGDRDEQRTAHGLPLDRPIAVFGGQIHEGRGVEMMLDSARLAEAAGSPLLFLFIGEGSLAGVVDKEARGRTNLIRLPKMPREAFLTLASACDVGLVATVPGVSSFNFPTKTIDYLRAGLPVVAAVEPGSDYLDILIEGEVGDGADYTDPEAFYKTAERLATDRAVKASIAGNARKCLDEVFDVEHVADKVLHSIEPVERTNA